MKIGDRDTPGTRIFAEREFRESAQVLVATEAAGEGINLQFCWFMINYDIPWNPVRLEQRMGRIHRYGQEKDCLIFNFVSTNTREGRVLHKLFERIQAIEDDLDPTRTGKVFNVLGDVFPANLLEKMIRDMYAHNQMNEELIKQRIVEQVDIKRFEQHHQFTLEGLAKRNSTSRPSSASPPKPRNAGWSRKSSKIFSPRPPSHLPRRLHSQRRSGPTTRTFTASATCRARSGPLANASNPASANSAANTKTSSSTRTPERPHSGMGHPRPSAVRGRARRRERAGPPTTLQRGAFFTTSTPRHPTGSTCSAASIKDGRNNQLHRRLFAVAARRQTAHLDHQPADRFSSISPSRRRTRAVPDGDGLPDRSAAEQFLVDTRSIRSLPKSAAQRASETETIERHLEISLNELIHRQNLRMAEIPGKQAARRHLQRSPPT